MFEHECVLCACVRALVFFWLCKLRAAPSRPAHARLWFP